MDYLRPNWDEPFYIKYFERLQRAGETIHFGGRPRMISRDGFVRSAENILNYSRWVDLILDQSLLYQKSGELIKYNVEGDAKLFALEKEGEPIYVSISANSLKAGDRTITDSELEVILDTTTNELSVVSDYSHMQASGVQVNKFAKQPYIIFRLWVCFLRLRAPELPDKHPDGHISIWLLPFLRVRKGSHLPLSLLILFYPTSIPYASIYGFSSRIFYNDVPFEGEDLDAFVGLIGKIAQII